MLILFVELLVLLALIAKTEYVKIVPCALRDFLFQLLVVLKTMLLVLPVQVVPLVKLILLLVTELQVLIRLIAFLLLLVRISPITVKLPFVGNLIPVSKFSVPNVTLVGGSIATFFAPLVKRLAMLENIFLSRAADLPTPLVLLVPHVLLRKLP